MVQKVGKKSWSINLSTQQHLSRFMKEIKTNVYFTMEISFPLFYITKKETITTRHINICSPFGVLGHIPRNVNNSVLRRQKLVEVCHSSYEFFAQNSLMLSFLSFLYQKLNIFSVLTTLNQRNRLLTFLLFSQDKTKCLKS